MALNAVRGGRPAFDLYVGLDLGSETMAAYYETADSSDRGMVDLQALAELLIDDPDKYVPDYLVEKEETGATRGFRSRRLRTRFDLRPSRQPKDLPDAHAELEFVEQVGTKLRRHADFDSCLFRYFYNKDPNPSASKNAAQNPLGYPNLIPNPKIIFQFRIDRMTRDMRVEARGHSTSSEFVEISAEKLLFHMITQVVRNLVLRSPQIRDKLWVEEEGEQRRARVHLTVTMPCVYSLAHAEAIVDYLRQHTDIEQIDYVFESDAIAYFALGSWAAMVPEMARLQSMRRAQEKLEPGRGSRLVTIDIGRGTTDLSMIEVMPPAMPGGPNECTILARTGRSDGGNKLSYILAEHYDKQLRMVFDTHGVKDGAGLPFSFCELNEGEARTELNANRAVALSALEALIEAVKRNLTEDYRVSVSANDQRPLIEEVLDSVFDGVAGAESIRPILREAMVLPARLPGWAPSTGLLGRLMLRLGRRAAKMLRRGSDTKSQTQSLSEEDWLRVEADLVELRDQVEAYVRSNVDDLIEELARMAVRGSRHDARTVYSGDRTYVIVAGQAAQFEPMKAAIRRKFSSANQRKRIFHLPGRDAKEACCRGAVDLKLSGHLIKNPEHLHGIYGFAERAGTGEPFGPVDMVSLNRGEEFRVEFKASANRWLVYSPCASIDDVQACLRSGLIAFLGSTFAQVYPVRYDGERRQLFVNGNPVRLAGFGDVFGDLWSKLWPEKLRPYGWRDEVWQSPTKEA